MGGHGPTWLLRVSIACMVVGVSLAPRRIPVAGRSARQHEASRQPPGVRSAGRRAALSRPGAGSGRRIGFADLLPAQRVLGVRGRHLGVSVAAGVGPQPHAEVTGHDHRAVADGPLEQRDALQELLIRVGFPQMQARREKPRPWTRRRTWPRCRAAGPRCAPGAP